MFNKYFRIFVTLALALTFCEHVTGGTTNYCPEYCAAKSSRYTSSPHMRIRKDVKCMTKREWDDFSYALREIHKRGVFDRLSEIHVRYWSAIHDHAEFLIWHRIFIFICENELRKVIPTVTVPYWVSLSIRIESNFILI